MTALVCVFVFARPVRRLFVCLLTKWLQTGGKVGHVCLLFSEAETFDQLFPSEDNDESAPFHPPLFAIFTACFLIFLSFVITFLSFLVSIS